MSDVKSITLQTVLRTAYIRATIERGEISAGLYHKGSAKKCSQMLAYASAPLSDCRVHVTVSGSASLWIDHTAFEINPERAKSTAEALAIPFSDDRPKPSTTSDA